MVIVIRVRGESVDETFEHEANEEAPRHVLAYRCECDTPPFEGFPIPFSRQEIVIRDEEGERSASQTCPVCGLTFTATIVEGTRTRPQT